MDGAAEWRLKYVHYRCMNPCECDAYGAMVEEVDQVQDDKGLHCTGVAGSGADEQ